MTALLVSPTPLEHQRCVIATTQYSKLHEVPPQAIATLAILKPPLNTKHREKLSSPGELSHNITIP